MGGRNNICTLITVLLFVDRVYVYLFVYTGGRRELREGRRGKRDNGCQDNVATLKTHSASSHSSLRSPFLESVCLEEKIFHYIYVCVYVYYVWFGVNSE